MKKYLKIIILIIIIINSGCGIIPKSTKNATKVLELRSFHLNNTLSVFIVVDTIQKASNQGLAFSLKIRNNSVSSDTISNPLNFLNLELKNDSDVNVLYPYQPNFPHPIKDYSFKSFNIEKVTLNKKKVDIDLEQGKFLIVPAKKTYEIFFNITDILKSKAVLPYTLDQRIKTMNGKYKLAVSISMVHGMNIKTSNIKNAKINVNIFWGGPLIVYYAK